jgi:4-hydroxy-tetrahydrodipicolinate reductase
MRAAIIGYGKMGHEIERILTERGHVVQLIVDVENRTELDKEHLQGVDVALEFTTPDTAYDNIRACIDAGVAVVSGTTGWTTRLQELQHYCTERQGALFYASNYSLGVNLLFRLNRQLADIVGHMGGYNVSIEETHHTQKKDAPSGTAITLADDIIARMPTKQSWVNCPTDCAEQIGIVSKREGMVPGIHTVVYESEDDLLTLKHELKSRRALAQGAVVAAEFLCGKRGVYTMDDLLK